VATGTMTGQNFTPKNTTTLNSYLGTSLKQTWTAPVGCNGGFTTTFKPAALEIGSAKVTANDGNGRFASATFSILA